MTRRSLLAAALVAGTMLSGPALAAGPDAAAADAMVKTLTGWLPEKVKATNFLMVVPEGDHYRFTIDFGKLVQGFKPEKGKLEVSGIYDVNVSPPGPDGLMAVNREAAPMNFSGNWDIDKVKGSFAYLLKDVVFSGQFDPELRYFRSAMMHSSGGTLQSDDGKAQIQANFGPYDATMSGAKNAAGGVDAASTATIAGFTETVRGPDMPPVTLAAANLGVDAKLTGLRVEPISKLIAYGLEHFKEGVKPTPDEKRAVAALVKEAMPLMTALTEEIKVDGLSVNANGVGAKIGSLTYRFGFGGFTDDSEVHFAFSAENPDITGVPQMISYGNLVPKSVNLNLSVGGLNFASVINAFIDQANYESDEPLTKAQMDAIGKLFLKSGRVNIDVPEFAATSAFYNISVKGRFSTDVQAQPVKANAEFDVTAKDIDTTIKGIQELAKTVPDLNTASFGLMMAKGLAKNDPDGSSHWKVEVDDAGVVKVNGQVMPH